jgi:hypothetical protein
MRKAPRVRESRARRSGRDNKNDQQQAAHVEHFCRCMLDVQMQWKAFGIGRCMCAAVMETRSRRVGGSAWLQLNSLRLAILGLMLAHDPRVTCHAEWVRTPALPRAGQATLSQHDWTPLQCPLVLRMKQLRHLSLSQSERDYGFFINGGACRGEKAGRGALMQPRPCHRRTQCSNSPPVSPAALISHPRRSRPAAAAAHAPSQLLTAAAVAYAGSSGRVSA